MLRDKLLGILSLGGLGCAILATSTVEAAEGQNRYGGAERDLGYEVYTLKRDLEATNKRVSRLENDVKTGSSSGKRNQHVSYDRGNPTPPAPVSSRSTDGTYHRVQAGETLSSISRQWGVGVDRLIAENRITNPNALRIGQEVYIPGRKGSTAASSSPAPAPPSPASNPAATGSYDHVVRPGDTLSSIARRHGITASAIASSNRLIDPNAISVGQKLYIPNGSKPSSGMASTPPPAPAPSPAPAPAPEPTPRGNEVVAPDGYGFYQVEPGDTLHSIAISFGTNTKELRKLNELGGDTLHVGDFLLVPVPDESLYES